MEQLVEFISNHYLLAGVFILLLLMFLWSLLTALIHGKFMLSPDKVVYHINHSGAQLIDLRDESEYVGGHIEGAIHAGLDASSDITGKVSTNRESTIILYGDSTLALRCMRLLQVGGYRNVFCLNGSVNAWTEAGLPLVKDGS